VDGGPNHRNKAAFSNFSGVVWTGHKATIMRLMRLLIDKMHREGCPLAMV